MGGMHLTRPLSNRHSCMMSLPLLQPVCIHTISCPSSKIQKNIWWHSCLSPTGVFFQSYWQAIRFILSSRILTYSAFFFFKYVWFFSWVPAPYGVIVNPLSNIPTSLSLNTGIIVLMSFLSFLQEEITKMHLKLCILKVSEWKWDCWNGDS